MLTVRNFAVANASIALGVVLMTLLAGAPMPQARAQTIADKWASVPLPPAPVLKPVTVDPKTTALLMLDFMSQNCGKRPACVASLPIMKKLLADARAAKATVVYSIIANSTTANVMPDVAPLPAEPWIQAGPDKFLNTDLAKILKDKGIQTVIVTGTASNGAVLFTAAGAAFRGMNVVVPVDGMSASDPFADLSTAYTLLNAPSLSAKATLTKADMIKF
ncbi:MAG TPA: isochorismatase family protein [Xanthobacteraceae bacterium]|nr:isochorismatase family protein [Xanthobacteraceae bacterium]